MVIFIGFYTMALVSYYSACNKSRIYNILADRPGSHQKDLNLTATGNFTEVIIDGKMVRQIETLNEHQNFIVNHVLKQLLCRIRCNDVTGLQ